MLLMLSQAMVTRSFVVSMDMAHGVHPNYAEKHEVLHRPQLQQGLVIKTNSNQRYATNTVSSYFIR
jgi:aspartyl aminopeptidase